MCAGQPSDVEAAALPLRVLRKDIAEAKQEKYATEGDLNGVLEERQPHAIMTLSLRTVHVS